MTITFATNCWEGDWKYLLIDGCLERIIDRCCYKFDKRILVISNVKDMEVVKSYAQQKIDANIIDEYVVASELEDEVLEFFETPKDSFKTLNYFIGCATALYKCDTDFFLFFTGDVYIREKQNTWVQDALTLLNNSPEIFVTNPLWDNKHNEAKAESNYETEDLYIGMGFSDQCFMVRTSEARKPIYGEYNIKSERYPEYGGGAFEKRIDAYMQNHNLLRATSKKISYIHKSFPKRTLINRFLRYIGMK